MLLPLALMQLPRQMTQPPDAATTAILPCVGAPQTTLPHLWVDYAPAPLQLSSHSTLTPLPSSSHAAPTPLLHSTDAVLEPHQRCSYYVAQLQRHSCIPHSFDTSTDAASNSTLMTLSSTDAAPTQLLTALSSLPRQSQPRSAVLTHLPPSTDAVTSIEPKMCNVKIFQLWTMSNAKKCVDQSFAVKNFIVSRATSTIDLRKSRRNSLTYMSSDSHCCSLPWNLVQLIGGWRISRTWAGQEGVGSRTSWKGWPVGEAGLVGAGRDSWRQGFPRWNSDTMDNFWYKYGISLVYTIYTGWSMYIVMKLSKVNTWINFCIPCSILVTAGYCMDN